LLCDPTATSHHLTLVLHDALPISPVAPPGKGVAVGEEGVPIDLGEEPEFEELPGEAAVLLPRERPPGDIAGEPARARRRLRRPRRVHRIRSIPVRPVRPSKLEHLRRRRRRPPLAHVYLLDCPNQDIARATPPSKPDGVCAR